MLPREALSPDEILDELIAWDSDLNVERYWGERSLFLNPGDERPLGTIWVSIKDHDGENDRSSNLDRDGVYRLSFQLSRDAYNRRFGAPPTRPPKGGIVEIPGYDPTRLDLFMPHPVYVWMRWVMSLSPSCPSFEPLRPMLADSLEQIRRKWRPVRSTR
jgi:Family of unknown function (DUF6194)